ncbi:MAG: energy-coupling factor transporter transmembrane protein EcfT [Eggerthellaceae bacterium]|nr:energy-coupling factor transporter transmembrane protein EcfT [Eggerthellaceae bacterium]
MDAIMHIDARIKIVLLGLFFLFAFHARSVIQLIVVCILACIWVFASRIEIKRLAKAFFALAGIAIFTFVVQILLEQHGTTLFTVVVFGKSLAITQEGLAKAIRMIIVLIAVIAASTSFMKITPLVQLIEALKWMLYPLQKRGFHTHGFILALSVSFSFIPVLFKEFHMLRVSYIARGIFVAKRGAIQTLRLYTYIIAPLIRSSFRHAYRTAQAYISRCF